MCCEKHIDLILEEYLNIQMIEHEHDKGCSAEDYCESMKDKYVRNEVVSTDFKRFVFVASWSSFCHLLFRR